MKSTLNICSLLVLLLIMCSCHESNESQAIQNYNGVIDINISKALNNSQEFNLSDVIEDVDFITLESSAESFFRYAERIQVTENFILIVGVREFEQHRVLLFDRSGEYLRQIGHRGKGPGEYISFINATIDPKERYVIVFDGQKFLKYDIDGTFLKEQRKPEGSRYRKNSAPLFLDDDHFAVANNRPYKATDDFYKITVFDLDFRKTNRLLNAQNNDSLCLRRQIIKLLPGGGEKLFFESFINNIYALDALPEPVLRYHLIIDEDAYTLEDMTVPLLRTSSDRRFHSVINVTNMPDHLLITTEHNTKNEVNIYQFLYDKEEKETCLLQNDFDCYKPTGKLDKLMYSFHNDLFGIPVPLGYFSENTFSTTMLSMDYLAEMIDLKRFQELDVMLPDKRDELVNMIEGCTEEHEPLLVLLHYK